MKIAVLGAGAMGSLYGALLSKAQEVTLVDVNKELVEHINTTGIRCMEKDGTEQTYFIRAVLTGTNVGVQDLVIVFVKGIFTKDVIRENLSMIGKDTIVMTLQNGAGNNRDIAQFVNQDRILVGTSSHNSVVKGMGVIYHSGKGPTNIGPDVQTPENIVKAKKIAEIFKECGLETHVIEDIQKVLWQKLFVNCGINGLSMLTETQIGEVYKNPFLWDVCRELVQECVKVAEADGTHFEEEAAVEIVKQVCINDATGYASMYQDRINHRKTEIDRINGVIVELAEQYGILAPYNKMLVKLVHGIE